MSLVAVLLVGIGIAVVAVGFAARARESDRELAAAIGFGERTMSPRRGAPMGAVATETLGLAERAVSRWDPQASLRRLLERADVALRPAELVVLAASTSTAVAATAFMLSGSVWTILLPFLVAPFVTRSILRFLGDRRTRRFAAQLPDVLNLAAASMHAGHTFLRSLQMLAGDHDEPISGELRRVINETELGSPLIDSLDRLAARMELRDLELVVQAIRIQQTSGGQLAGLLETFAEFMRARVDLRREIAALTAEGRASAWMLGAMPLALMLVIQVVNPGYLEPMLRGWGLVWLGVTAASAIIGIAIILQMVRSVEL